MRFFIGMHLLSHSDKFDDTCISVNVLRRCRRVSDIPVNNWIMDSGAFTELSLYGRYRYDPGEYAAYVNRFRHCGTLLAAVSQDYMCEMYIRDKTGLTVLEHQRLTIERYDDIRRLVHPDVYVMPVLQGWYPIDYANHARAYGSRIHDNDWIGIGSVCKRQGTPNKIVSIIQSIQSVGRYRLHGFGVKKTSIRNPFIRDALYSADSMAWSFEGRRLDGKSANNWKYAKYWMETL